MSEIPIRGRTPNPATARTGQTGPSQVPKTEGKSDAQPAFKALLEKLEEKARVLQEESRTVDDAAHLAGAVEGARSSLEDALKLGEELLESFRANQQQDATPPAEEEAP